MANGIPEYILSFVSHGLAFFIIALCAYEIARFNLCKEKFGRADGWDSELRRIFLFLNLTYIKVADVHEKMADTVCVPATGDLAFQMRLRAFDATRLIWMRGRTRAAKFSERWRFVVIFIVGGLLWGLAWSLRILADGSTFEVQSLLSASIVALISGGLLYAYYHGPINDSWAAVSGYIEQWQAMHPIETVPTRLSIHIG